MSWASRWSESKPPKFKINEYSHAYVGSDDGNLIIIRESMIPMYLDMKPDVARKLAKWIDITFGEEN